LQAVVEAADEPVDHVAQGGGMSVAVLAAAVVGVLAPGECAAATSAQTKPAAARRSLFTRRLVIDRLRPDALVTGAEPA
jgi:hypothetical protein